MKIVSVIPARGGSKGLKRKNVLELGGKPLLGWTIEAAKQCALIDDIIVSTDDAEISETAKQFGARVPYLRSPELSNDTALTEAVLLDVIEWLETNEAQVVDILVYLQVTDPFRRKGIIDEVVRELLDNPELDTVFAACPSHKNYWVVDGEEYQRLSWRGYPPRQKKAPVYREDTGIACATRVEVVKAGKRIGDKVKIVSHETEGSFIDIHTELDLWLANQLIEQRGIYPNE